MCYNTLFFEKQIYQRGTLYAVHWVRCGVCHKIKENSMKKSLLITYGRALNDLGVALVETVEQAGGTDEDVRRIFKDEVLKKQIGLLFMGKLKLEEGMTPCQKNVPHLIPDWVKEVVEDVEPTKFDPAKLKFVGFLRDEDAGRTDGPTMRQRAKEMKSNLGLSDVPALLGPEDGKGLKTIPTELRGNVYIVLSGTLLRASGGRLFVPCLDWDDGRWVLNFRWLDRDWRERGRLVSCE